MWCGVIGTFGKWGIPAFPLHRLGATLWEYPAPELLPSLGNHWGCSGLLLLQLAPLPSRHHRYSPQQCYPVNSLHITQCLWVYVLGNPNCNMGVEYASLLWQPTPVNLRISKRALMICQIFTVVSVNISGHNKYQEHFCEHQDGNILLISKEQCNCCQRLSQWSWQRSRSQWARPLTLLYLQRLECSGQRGKVLITINLMVFGEFLPSNLFTSIQVPGAFPLELSPSGHRLPSRCHVNKRTFLKVF